MSGHRVVDSGPGLGISGYNAHGLFVHDRGIIGRHQGTKHLYNICPILAQRLRRWSNIVQMLYQCFVFAGDVGHRGVHAATTRPPTPALHRLRHH